MAEPPGSGPGGSPNRWHRAERLFREALDRPPEQRRTSLERACPDDPELRAEVERLLAAHEALERSERGSAGPGGAAASDAGLGRGASEASGFLAKLDAAGAAALLEAAGEDAAEGGREVGPYRIVARLARGGMGVVYLARDPRLDRDVALKLLPPWLAADELSKRRFTEEAKAASALDHPNIETIYEVGETGDGRLYIAMAYYEGETLEERIRRGPLPVAEAAEVASQVAEGLRAAHARGIVHRDVKPGNLILTPEGTAKIVDFGVAKVAGRALTKSGATLGTVAYMSPEQTRGEDVGAASDLWSLGVVLYEMLASRRPFGGASDRVLIHAIRNDEPEPVEILRPEVPPGLAAVIGRCLAKRPGDRHPDAGALLRDLLPLRPQARLAAPSGEPAPGAAGRGRLRRFGRKRALSLLAVGTLAAASLGLLLARSPPGSRGVVAGASSIAVIPPLAVSEDTALVRLGRELAVTLSANLAGVGGIRTVPAVTVLAQVDDMPYSLGRGAELARRLGATSVLHGSLLRSGKNIRLDFGLFGAEGLEPLAQAAVSAPADDITALTDSATLALLRGIWSSGRMPVPSLAAITTGSVVALKAYLEGEQALARADFPHAVGAFERAFAADSTFWFAYWRSLYPRTREGSSPDSAVLAAVVAHRDELPPPDRLLVESQAADSRGARLATLREVAQRYPDYWPGWWEYANELVHWGPFLGTSYPDARTALERVVALNPGFASGWEQLLWVAGFQRDTARAREALEAVERLAAPESRVGSGIIVLYRALEGLARTGGEFRGDGVVRLARATLAVAPRGTTRRSRNDVPGAEEISTNLLAHGFPRAQIQQADAILAEESPADVAGAFWMGKALAWAARGAWDSALVAAERSVRLWSDPWASLRAYGLAAAGAWLGGVEPELATPWRGDAARAAATVGPEARAELAWLDGLVAYARGDVKDIARAREEVRESGALFADLLTRSLAPFELEAAGEREEAARSLAALEWESAEAGLHASYGPFHPYLPSVNRLSAGRWLLAAGDTTQAGRLLTWHEALLWGAFDRVEAVSRVVEPLALLERARIEEAQGLLAPAAAHYAGFLERYDMPPPGHGALVEQALQALRRLSTPEEG